MQELQQQKLPERCGSTCSTYIIIRSMFPFKFYVQKNRGKQKNVTGQLLLSILHQTGANIFRNISIDWRNIIFLWVDEVLAGDISHVMELLFLIEACLMWSSVRACVGMWSMCLVDSATLWLSSKQTDRCRCDWPGV